MNHRMRLDENQVSPAKGKGGRYQPASEYDDATLAQKREYWRNKKREQRARLAQQRGRVDSRDRKPQHSCSPEGLDSHLSAPAASSSPYLRSDVSECRNTFLKEAADTQKEEWLQKAEVNKVFLSVLAEAADEAIGRRSAARVVKGVPSALSSGSRRKTGPSVPTVRVVRVNNGAPPPRRGSLQDRSVPQTLCKPETALAVPATHGTGARNSCKESEAKATHPTAKPGAKRPLQAPQKPLTLSEEEKAAKRREQWRIKKREQRAKTAARVAEQRQRAQSRELTAQRERARLTQRSGLQTAPCPALRSLSSPTDERLQSAAIPNIQKSPANDPYACGVKTAQKKPQNPIFYSNVTRGILRCKTPRQRCIEVQKNLSSQRNLRCKSQSAASAFGTKNIPRIDLRDTPETVIAKRREYWRVKKREQRAKLTMEMKTRLREKDSLMRRDKRYQQILYEMRKARAASGSPAAQVSEAIGGFIREDGTVAVNIPQSPKCHHTAGQRREEEHHKVSRNSPIIPQRKHRSFAPIRTPQPAPPLRPSCPALQWVRSSPRSLSVKTTSALLPSRDPTPGSNLGRCVMRVAVTRRFSSRPSSDSGVSEELRVARKREYWRTKKREQRAALAARLKLGLSAALKRKRAQRQEAAAPPQPCPALTDRTRDGLPLYSTVPAGPQPDDIKLEGESVQAADPEEAVCPDRKPPAPPPALPESQQEADPCQGADSQAATLLAVASMKKLLEESLSSVSSCTDIKIETVEDVLERDTAVSPPPSDVHRDSISPITADVAMLLKDWQPDEEEEKKPNLQLQSSSPMNETGLFLPISTDVIGSTPTFSAQSPPDLSESFGASNDLIPPCPAQGLSCSTEPPKLHHITRVRSDRREPEEDTPRQTTEKWRGATSPPSQSPGRAGTEQQGSSSLQRKREYWKLMKRQQRARLKERRGEARRSLLLTGSIQINQILQSNLPGSSGGAGSSVPPLLLVSQSTSNTQKPLGKLHVKLPVSSRLEKTSTPNTTDFTGVLESQQYSQKWIPRTNEGTCVPSLPALTPPDNPLSSLNLQLYESPAQSPTSITGPREVAGARPQVPDNLGESSIKAAPPCTMLPPKLIPGESQKDFLKRKREYWRVKKKEQRAKKAIQKKGLRTGPSSWSPTLHPHDLQPQAGPAQGSGQWGISSEHLDGFKSLSVDSHPGQCSGPIKDESEALYPDDEEDGSLSATAWRRHYLMDYDPLNQLLVCMVCGELQYSHSLEGVRAHIDEAHPHSMTLEPQEKQQILEAWEEQVSQRERFFSRQLQQNSRDLAGVPSETLWRE
ncbi:hypothetical protein OJAV_G00178110 [Oryzias javanicus]|uniref:SPIN-DOC-like zinc-finger domain-containing protein n=1 Tax=Oryzias javanicus TaxID=123683 RepID=A0A3S2PG05_ORYJA|nr:hypothetical protein OJAV_G00178110 [Oryzias javanicus]